MANSCAGDTLVRNPGRMFIGGGWVSPSGTKRFDVIVPSTEELYFQVPEAEEADIDRAVSAARHAFDNGPWPDMKPVERAVYLNAVADKLNERSGDLSRMWTNQTGAVFSFSEAITPFVTSFFKYYADLAETFPFIEEHTPAVGEMGLLVREPVGVVAAIVPWNAPLMTVVTKIAPALLAGCTVVVKTAPETPVEAYLLAEAFEAVGLPPGVVNIVTAGREVSERLVRHPGIDKVSFTGSSLAGKRIASICGERIARCTLELGGKSAAVVMDDYDVEPVAQMLAAASCNLTSQVCAALSRVVVTRRRHDQLAEALAAAYGALKVGDPYDPSTQMGPLAMSRQRDRVEHYIAAGRAQGATVAVGGGRPSHLNRGFYVEPTVFANVDNGWTIAQEEIFGPVVSIIPADDEAHAIRIANDSPFGLNASVFTNDIDKAYAAARQIRSGTVGHNGFRSDFGIAFGGFKQSGIGREGGREGLMPYLEAKTVILDGRPAHL